MQRAVRATRLGILLVAAATAGCQSMDEEMVQTTQPEKMPALNVVDITAADRSKHQFMMAEDVDSFGALGQPPLYSSVQGAYKGRPLTKHVGDYVKALTQDLIANMEYVTNKTPVGVTHFALLDSDLQQTNLLGQQMAESFVHELHKFHIPVIA